MLKLLAWWVWRKILLTRLNYVHNRSFLLTTAAATINAYWLDCKYENIDHWGTHYSCRALNFDLFCGDRNITAVTGLHTELNTYDQVGKLFILTMNSECIPRNVHTWFKNLRSVYIVNSLLSELHGDDLLGLHSLEYLDLADNLIDTVPAKFFDHTPNLVQVSLFKNRIKHFETAFLPQLTKLNYFDLRLNVCIDIGPTDPRALREGNALLKIQCKSFERYSASTTIADSNCNNSTCFNAIYEELRAERSRKYHYDWNKIVALGFSIVQCLTKQKWIKICLISIRISRILLTMKIETVRTFYRNIHGVLWNHRQKFEAISWSWNLGQLRSTYSWVGNFEDLIASIWLWQSEIVFSVGEHGFKAIVRGKTDSNSYIDLRSLRVVAGLKVLKRR